MIEASTTLLVMAGILFVMAYLSKRRYGLLGLGLIAGSLISVNWASYVTLMLQAQGVSLSTPPLSLVVAIGVLLLPALILMVVAPKYKKIHSRLVGSAFFAILGMTLVIAEFHRSAQNLLEPSFMLAYINQYQAIIIVVAIVAALVDVFHTHLPKKKIKDPSH